MEPEISRMISLFESGRMSRRQLVAHLSALTAAVAGLSGTAQARDGDGGSGNSTFKATSLNHIALRVTDVPRSRDFYAKHLGLTVDRESSSSCFMTFGKDFLALFQGSTPGLDHYCYSIENYDVDEAVETLKAHNLDPRRPSGSNRVYFDDPDGIEVQLASQEHAPS